MNKSVLLYSGTGSGGLQMKTVGATFNIGKLCKRILWVLEIGRGSASQTKFMGKKHLSWVVGYWEGTSS